jgi:endonuclease/exonuclease/phosphatase (EEP) superfamily protein YafD
LVRSLRQAWKFDPIDGSPFWLDGHPAAEALPDQFRVSIWNICKGAGGRLFEHDYRCLAYQSEIVVLQEALLSQRSLKTYCEPGFEVVHAGSYVRKDLLRDGVVTASRARFEPHKLRVVCKYPEPVFRTPKVAFVSWHRLERGASPLMLINLHATLVRGARRAADEMRNLMDSLPPHRGPALLCGDLNTFTGNHFRAVEQILAASGFEHVRIDEDPRRQTGSLDHAFVKGLSVESSRVLTTVRSSDHFPLLITLRLP